jgi:hypothetical protein
MSAWTRFDPCPDSVWELLPGGREARNDVNGEVWEYTRTWILPDHFTHGFRHGSHPLYDDHVVFADVRDHDAGPHLSSIFIFKGGWDGEIVTFDELGNEVRRE